MPWYLGLHTGMWPLAAPRGRRDTLNPRNVASCAHALSDAPNFDLGDRVSRDRLIEKLEIEGGEYERWKTISRSSILSRLICTMICSLLPDSRSSPFSASRSEV